MTLRSAQAAAAAGAGAAGPLEATPATFRAGLERFIDDLAEAVAQKVFDSLTVAPQTDLTRAKKQQAAADQGRSSGVSAAQRQVPSPAAAVYTRNLRVPPESKPRVIQPSLPEP